MINKNRHYGIEIECHGKLSHSELRQKIEQRFSLIPILRIRSINSTRYQHEGRENSSWIIKPDGSVGGIDQYPTGTELASPVLRGESGLIEITELCEAIEPHVKVSRKCGLHVHHDMSDMNTRTMRELFEKLKASRVEGVLIQGVPLSRINNTYCQSIANASWNDVSRGRYWTFNFKSFIMRGTLEIRLHSGTVEPEKINNWIVLTQAILEKLISEPERNIRPINSWADMKEWLSSNLPIRRVTTRTRTEMVTKVKKRITGKHPLRRGSLRHKVFTIISNGGGLSDVIAGFQSEGIPRNQAIYAWNYIQRWIREEQRIETQEPQEVEEIIELPPESQEPLSSTVPMEPAVVKSLDWFKSRIDKFKAIKNGGDDIVVVDGDDGSLAEDETAVGREFDGAINDPNAPSRNYVRVPPVRIRVNNNCWDSGEGNRTQDAGREIRAGRLPEENTDEYPIIQVDDTNPNDTAPF